MLSNIEQAVLDLLSTNASITVPGVFAAYMRIAGHDIGDTEKAVATFERALDKHAVRPQSQSQIEKLRNEYWYDKLGGCKDGDGVCHMCEHCGGMRLKDKDKDKRHRQGLAGGGFADTTASRIEELELPPKPRRLKQVKFGKKNKGRVCRKVRPDPYAPSTSTARL
ncbi:hypothetical protein D9615_008874 [Tricholomella constricta]|uniref:Uncharacterized protein n=1 Tax=Tricholomella constricta TaxID=117010 RepID=A0A8H5GZU2_9AGAR|nr:hypothetical protein D9615_008874 [Tricholomella constricta]